MAALSAGVSGAPHNLGSAWAAHQALTLRPCGQPAHAWGAWGTGLARGGGGGRGELAGDDVGGGPGLGRARESHGGRRQVRFASHVGVWEYTSAWLRFWVLVVARSYRLVMSSLAVVDW